MALCLLDLCAAVADEVPPDGDFLIQWCATDEQCASLVECFDFDLSARDAEIGEFISLDALAVDQQRTFALRAPR